MADAALVSSVTASWGAWSDQTVELALPSGWRPITLAMSDAPELTSSEIDQALASPVGAPTLEALARVHQRVAIAIDDVTRPTRTAPILSRLVSRLTAVGIEREAITIILATGAHRGATADDIRLKVGALAAQVRVISHDPVNDVAETGVLLAGQAVRVNRYFLEADLRIGVGSVMPHPFAGFSGGGKIVLPGLADLDVVVRSHKYALMGFAGGLALEGNRFRTDMERAVREIGLHWTVNIAMNSGCRTAALVAGDVVAAHRQAVERARAIGTTSAPDQPLDALLLNAHPKDGELLQTEAALVPVRAGMIRWLRPQAPVLLVAACPEGLGAHQLFGPGGRLYRKPTRKSYLGDRLLHVVSPATRADSGHAAYCDAYPYHATWEACVDALRPLLPAQAVVGFAPNGPLHVPAPGLEGQQ